MAQREGYLMIDHRASPGIPEETSIAIGLDPKLTGEGKLLEAASLTCAHCKTVVMKNPLRVRERYHCHKCSHKYICDFCAAATREPFYNHKPFEQLLDEAARKAAQEILGSPPKLLTP